MKGTRVFFRGLDPESTAGRAVVARRLGFSDTGILLNNFTLLAGTLPVYYNLNQPQTFSVPKIFLPCPLGPTVEITSKQQKHDRGCSKSSLFEL